MKEAALKTRIDRPALTAAIILFCVGAATSAALAGVLAALRPAGGLAIAGWSIAVLLAAAQAAAAAAVLRGGLGRIARDLRGCADSEPHQLMVRGLYGVVVMLFGAAWALTEATPGPLFLATLILAAGCAGAWALIADMLVRRRSTLGRKLCAMGIDCGILSATLIAGGQPFAALWPFYLWAILGHGFRYGRRGFGFCGAFACAGFVAVIALSPFWRANLSLSTGLLIGLVAVPSYAAKLVGTLVRARVQAEAVSSAKSRFLAEVSHELRTPLNAVIGFSEMMGKEMLGPLGNARYRAYADDINRSGQHLLGLINDLLDFSKIEAGRFALQEAPFNLREALETCARMLAPRAEAASVSLRLELALATETVRGDEQRLMQVVLNLLMNAVKYTPAGGRVTLAARIAEGGIEIRVVDTGVGIARDSMAKIFEAFGQVANEINRTTPGTGLGLPIAKSLAELHGGNLVIDSRPGLGTTAVVTLPAHRLVWNRAAPAA